MLDAVININGTYWTGNRRVEFINNAKAFFFESISFELNRKEVGNVSDSEIMNAIRDNLCYSTEDSTSLIISGWNYLSVFYSKDGELYLRLWSSFRRLQICCLWKTNDLISKGS